MSSSKKGKKFAELVAGVGTLDVSVLASAQPYPVPSSLARRVAQLMVGAVSPEEQRVDRLATLLDDLVAADATSRLAKQPKKRRAS